jgi:hypothetical protein
MSRCTIYRPLKSLNFELCHPVDPSDFFRLNELIAGTPRQSSWQPIRVELIRENLGTPLKRSDSPWLGWQSLIFRPRVVEVLGSLLRSHGELLPLMFVDDDLVVFNPTRIIDVLDESASATMRMDNGQIFLIQRHVFRPGHVTDRDVFKIPNLRVRPTFVGHEVVQRWRLSGLRGLDFEPVWNQNDDS